MELSQAELYQIPKVTFSKEVCQILDAVKIEEALREGHRLRAEFGGLKQISDYSLIRRALENYVYMRTRKQYVRTRNEARKRAVEARKLSRLKLAEGVQNRAS
jgi:hypothetical protein